MNTMDISPEQVTGVLLAAGRSRRMGTPKLLLPWPRGAPSTMIAAAFDAIAPFCGRMIVVVGDDPHALAGALGSRPHVAIAGAPDADMFTSIQRGLAAVVGAEPSPAFVLLHPGDHPMVGAQTISTLLRRASSSPSALAVIPERAGRGGHPVVIAAGAIARILTWRGEGGLAGFWREHAVDVIRLPVNDPSVILDLDTPEDYERAMTDGASDSPPPLAATSC